MAKNLTIIAACCAPAWPSLSRWALLCSGPSLTARARRRRRARTSSSSRPTISATATSAPTGRRNSRRRRSIGWPRDGMRFTQYYAGSTVCAPSRAALMTGLHTGHAWIRGNGEISAARRGRDRRDGAARRRLPHGGHRQVGTRRAGHRRRAGQEGLRLLVRLPRSSARAPAVHGSSLSQRRAVRDRRRARLRQRSVHEGGRGLHREGGHRGRSSSI